MGKNREFEQLHALEPFADIGIIEEVLGTVKSGKEATVYLCSGGSQSPVPLVAAKVYRARTVRGFADDAVYREGRSHRHTRENRAILTKSKLGRTLAFNQWVEAEFETLELLYEARVPVPQPLRRAESAIAMAYIGDEDEPAPTLAASRLDVKESQHALAQILESIELMLACNRVHGDLSAHNVLYWESRAIVIDLPQAVDARVNSSALTLLERDVDRIGQWAARTGSTIDAWRFARDIWGRYLRSEL